MTRQEFFYYNAGSSHDPLTETPDEGRVRGAMQLAQAEAYAQEQGWSYEWDTDRGGGKCDCGQDHYAEACQLWSGDKVLASLVGICSPTDDYRRVVQAELALDAMGWPAPAPQEAQEAAAAPVPRYTVNLHAVNLYTGDNVQECYRGDDEDVMYSHVSAMEWVLMACHGTAEIEIVEDGRSRWIDYADGKRTDMTEDDMRARYQEGGGTPCPDCDGTGELGIRCDDCRGEGCANCNGTGYPKCCRCSGAGIIEEAE